jgi:hypothetical protein
VIAAALVVALTGTLFALSAAQLWMNFTLYGIFRAVAWAMLGLGSSACGCGPPRLHSRSRS